MFGFDYVAGVAAGDMVHNVLLHARPPKYLFQILVHLGTSGVNGIGGLMGFLEDLLL